MVANLKKLRTEHNISQQHLANVIGVSQQSVNKYENQNIEPDITTLMLIADYFHVTVDYLIGHDEEMNSRTEKQLFCLDKMERSLLDSFRFLPEDLASSAVRAAELAERGDALARPPTRTHDGHHGIR